MHLHCSNIDQSSIRSMLLMSAAAACVASVVTILMKEHARHCKNESKHEKTVDGHKAKANN